MDCQVDIIPTEGYAPAFQEAIRPLIDSFLEHDTWQSLTTDEVLHHLVTGRDIGLMTTANGMVQQYTVVQLHECPGDQRILFVLGTAGSGMASWLDALVAKLVELAQVMECTSIDFQGRMGWIRTLRKYGFEATTVQMRLEVDGRQEQTAQRPNAAVV